ncbi:MAG: hypothetical protein WAQ28_04020 [Bacteroidia bacterium]
MQLLLNIKDKNKAALLLEFLKSLNYVSSVKQVDDETSDFTITDEDKRLVDERRKSAKASDYMTRKQSSEKIKKKYGF